MRINFLSQVHFLHPAVILIMLMSGACNPARKFVSEADKLQSEGKYEDASRYYYNALLSKPGHRQAKEGLKVCAQRVLNDKFIMFRQHVLENRIEDAVKQYRYAVMYEQTARDVGVVLDWPGEYDEIYDDVKREYTGILFDAAIGFMNLKKYDLAEKKIMEIAAIDTAYKNVSVLRLNTVLEPLYHEGIRMLENGRYEDAYTAFSKISNLDESYLDIVARKEEALKKATTRIGILPVVAGIPINGHMIDHSISARIQQVNRAFVKIVDHEPLKQTLESRGWSVIATPELAVQAGKNLGLQSVLFTRIRLITDTVYPKTVEKRTAYEAFTENIPNPYSDTYSYITKFKVADYTDTYEGQYIEYMVNTSLISCVDSKIIFTDSFDVKKTNEIHQFDYKGNTNHLYEQLPQGNYLPSVNSAWREQFQVTKRKLVDRKTLETQLADEIADRIAFGFNKALK